MSYQVIARKWRPKTFDEVIGQRHITTPLRNAIRTDRVPHAVLLTGPRGVGKTTLARIFARCLNCEKGPTDEPCGTCKPCEDITAGRSMDVQEVDAASDTSVDGVRRLIESIGYAASLGKYRIFVIDEVHMLSTSAFNALLKTLEEPPARSLFLLATTIPEKIPFTVLSRCQRYDLRRINTADVAEQLRMIAESEGITISPGSLLAIAREGEGSMRDAQTLLDQLIAYSGKEIGDEMVAQVLDLIDRRVLLAVVGACIDGDAAAALDACAGSIETGSSPKRLGAALVQLLRDLVVVAVAPDSPGLVEGGEAELAELRELAARTDATRLRRMFRALIREQEDLAWAPHPYAVLEMALVRLATMADGDDVERLLGRIGALEQRLGAGGRGSPSGAAGPARSGSAQPAKGGGHQAAAPPPAQTQSAAGPAEAPPAAPTQSDAAPAEAPPAAPTQSDAAPVAPPPTARVAPDAPLDEVFDQLRRFAQEHDRGAFASLEGGRLLEREKGRVRLAVRNSFQASRLREHERALEHLCEQFFGEPTTIEVAEQDAPDAAPAADRAGPSHERDDGESREDARERARQVRQAALQNPAINTALEVLEAQIVDITPHGGPNP